MIFLLPTIYIPLLLSYIFPNDLVETSWTLNRGVISLKDAYLLALSIYCWIVAILVAWFLVMNLMDSLKWSHLYGEWNDLTFITFNKPSKIVELIEHVSDKQLVGFLVGCFVSLSWEPTNVMQNEAFNIKSNQFLWQAFQLSD